MASNQQNQVQGVPPAPPAPALAAAGNASAQMAALALKIEQDKIPEFSGQKGKDTVTAMELGLTHVKRTICH